MRVSRSAVTCTSESHILNQTLTTTKNIW